MASFGGWDPMREADRQFEEHNKLQAELALRAAEREKLLAEERKRKAEEAAARIKARWKAEQDSLRTKLEASRRAVYAGDPGSIAADTQSALDKRARSTNPLGSNYTQAGFGDGQDRINAAWKAKKAAAAAKLRPSTPQSADVRLYTTDAGATQQMIADYREATGREPGPEAMAVIREAAMLADPGYKEFAEKSKLAQQQRDAGVVPEERPLWTSSYRQDRTHTGFAAEKAGGGSEARRQQLEALRAKLKAREQDRQARLATFREVYSKRHLGAPRSEIDATTARNQAIRAAMQEFTGGTPGVGAFGLALGPEAVRFHPENVAALARAQAIAGLGEGGQPVTADVINAALGGLAGGPMPAALTVPAGSPLPDITKAADKATQAAISKGDPTAIAHMTRTANMPHTEAAVYQNPAVDQPTKEAVRSLVRSQNFTGASTLLRGKVPDYALDVLMREWTGNQTADRDDNTKAFPWEGNIGTVMNPELDNWKRYYFLPGAGWEVIKQRFGF